MEKIVVVLGLFLLFQTVSGVSAYFDQNWTVPEYTGTVSVTNSTYIPMEGARYPFQVWISFLVLSLACVALSGALKHLDAYFMAMAVVMSGMFLYMTFFVTMTEMAVLAVGTEVVLVPMMQEIHDLPLLGFAFFQFCVNLLRGISVILHKSIGEQEVGI